MIGRTPLALTFAMLCAYSAAPAAAQAGSDLYGGWVISGWQAPEGQEGPVPQRGLFMFTESGHYSMMYVIGEARAPLSDEPTDADIAASYNPFIANSGRYSVSGSEVTYEAFVAKDPAYMSLFEGTGGAGNPQSFTYSLVDGVLTLRFDDNGPMQGSTATLRRPGGGQ